VRDLGEALGLSSTRTVHDHLNRLEELGFIRRHRDRSRAIEILREPEGMQTPGRQAAVDQVTVPLIGEVAAGSPILAEENKEAEFVLDPSLIRDPRTYMLRVRGESMIEAHICDGDYILIEPRAEARNGEIVVVLIGNDVTLKRFFRRDGYVELMPENSNMASIILTPEIGDARVLGRLAGVIRRC